MDGYATNQTRPHARGPGEAPHLPLQGLTPRTRNQPRTYSAGSGSKYSRGDHSNHAGRWAYGTLADSLGLLRAGLRLCPPRRSSPGRTTRLPNRPRSQSRGLGLFPASGRSQTLDRSPVDRRGPQGGRHEAYQPGEYSAFSKKNVCKPWRKVMWCIGRITVEYRERMYDLLGLYAKPYDPTEPVVCLDEKSKQLLEQTRGPIPVAPGQVAKEDYEYKRAGTRNLFVAVEPKAGHREVKVTRRRTKPTFVPFVHFLALEVYARARKIHLVLDNLNT